METCNALARAIAIHIALRHDTVANIWVEIALERN